MNRTRLRNKLWKSRSIEEKLVYNKQRNSCLPLNIKTKRDYYNNLDNKKAINNKSFWKFVKPHFSDEDSAFLNRSDLILIKMMYLVPSTQKCRTQYLGLMKNTKITLELELLEKLAKTASLYLKIHQSQMLKNTQQKKMKFFIQNFFSKCDQIRSFLRIWSHLLRKSLM